MHPILLLLPLALAAADAAPITLDEALAAAAKSNVDLRIAGTDRSLVGVEEYASWAGVLPRLDLAASFGNQYTAPSTQNITRGFLIPPQPPSTLPTLGYELSLESIPANDVEQYSLGLTLSIPIFDGMRNWATIARAKALLRAADKTYDEASLNVAFEVTRRFYEVVRAERSLTVLQEAVRRSEELVRRTDELYQAGRAPRSETWAARVTLGNDRISAEQQVARVSDARVALSTALGRDADPELRVVPPVNLDKVAFQEPPVQTALVDLARRKRPLLNADEQRVQAAAEEIRSAQAGYYPSVSAQASYNRQGPYIAGPQGVYGDPDRTVRRHLRRRGQLEPLRGPDHERQRPAGQPERAADPARLRAELADGHGRDRPLPRRLPDPLHLGRAGGGEPQAPRRRACSSPFGATTPAPGPRSRSATPCSTSPGPSSSCSRPASTPSSPAPT